MKIAILNDLHFGARNGNSVFEKELEKFLGQYFFPYLKEEGIGSIIVAGDLLDDRKAVNVKTLNLLQRSFLEPAQGYDVHIIPGNHDIYYKNSLTPNSIDPVVSRYGNIHFYKQPTTVNFDGYTIGFVPWICAENEDECMEYINSVSARTLVTHTEVVGSQSVPGIFTDFGHDPETFFQYDYILNGHIHTRSQIAGNVFNMGTQYQMNWSDFNQKKGFHVFDTSDVKLEFVPNDLDLYVKIFYEDNLVGGADPLMWLDSQLTFLKNKFIKIIITGSVDRFLFDKFLQKMTNDVYTHDIKVIEDMSNIFDENFDEDLIKENKSTIHIIHEMIDELNVDKSFNREILKSLMSKFYTEAINKDTFVE